MRFFTALLLLLSLSLHECQEEPNCYYDEVPQPVWTNVPFISKYRPAPEDGKMTLVKKGEDYIYTCPFNEFLIVSGSDNIPLATLVLINYTINCDLELVGTEENLDDYAISCLKDGSRGGRISTVLKSCTATIASSLYSRKLEALIVERKCGLNYKLHVAEIDGENLLRTHIGKELTCTDGWKFDGSELALPQNSKLVTFCVPDSKCSQPPQPVDNVYIEYPGLAPYRPKPIYERPYMYSLGISDNESELSAVVLDCSSGFRLSLSSSKTLSLISYADPWPVICDEQAARWKDKLSGQMPNDAQMFCVDEQIFTKSQPNSTIDECAACFNYTHTDGTYCALAFIYDYACGVGERIRMTPVDPIGFDLKTIPGDIFTGNRLTCSDGWRLDGKVIAKRATDLRYLLQCESASTTPTATSSTAATTVTYPARSPCSSVGNGLDPKHVPAGYDSVKPVFDQNGTLTNIPGVLTCPQYYHVYVTLMDMAVFWPENYIICNTINKRWEIGGAEILKDSIKAFAAARIGCLRSLNGPRGTCAIGFSLPQGHSFNGYAASSPNPLKVCPTGQVPTLPDQQPITGISCNVVKGNPPVTVQFNNGSSVPMIGPFTCATTSIKPTPKPTTVATTTVSTTTKSVPATCPLGGVWGEWMTADTCTPSCGSCGKAVDRIRMCDGRCGNCECSGSYSRKYPVGTIESGNGPCGVEFCNTPTAKCCEGSVETLNNITGRKFCGNGATVKIVNCLRP